MIITIYGHEDPSLALLELEIDLVFEALPVQHSQKVNALNQHRQRRGQRRVQCPTERPDRLVIITIYGHVCYN